MVTEPPRTFQTAVLGDASKRSGILAMVAYVGLVESNGKASWVSRSKMHSKMLEYGGEDVEPTSVSRVCAR